MAENQTNNLEEKEGKKGKTKSCMCCPQSNAPKCLRSDRLYIQHVQYMITPKTTNIANDDAQEARAWDSHRPAKTQDS